MENVINSIYGLKPVNKTSATVTGQTGCQAELTDAQRKQNLSARVNQLNQLLSTSKLSKKHPERIALSKEFETLSRELQELRERLKLKPKKRDASPFFIILAKKHLSKFQYEKIMDEAIKAGIKYDWDTDAMKADELNG